MTVAAMRLLADGRARARGDRGVMAPTLLYEIPFADINRRGVEGMFGQQSAAEVIPIIDGLSRREA
jgi:hypothetical protein